VLRFNNSLQVSENAPVNNPKNWLIGARPKTLPAAIAPILVGTALIRVDHRAINWLNALLALLVGLLLQIAVNYSNDYSDGVRGSDSDRVGPTRLVASGLVSAPDVKKMAYVTFFAASICGLLLSLRTSPWLILVGIISILAAWNYTGGKNPYGYKGFGEISVFTFFGLVATMGSYFAQSKELTSRSFLAAIPMGIFSCIILALNNLRDLPKDQLVNKKTVAVRLGDQRARFALVGLLAVAQLSSLALAFISPLALLTLVVLPFTVAIGKSVIAGAKGAELIPLLGKAGKLQLVSALLITLALATK
jgi:1,4-dihydroxy-2-naphthoate octaprenyltransferase